MSFYNDLGQGGLTFPRPSLRTVRESYELGPLSSSPSRKVMRPQGGGVGMEVAWLARGVDRGPSLWCFLAWQDQNVEEGGGLGGVAGTPRPPKTVKNRENCQKCQYALGGRVGAVVCCHWGWEETAKTVKHSSTIHSPSKESMGKRWAEYPEPCQNSKNLSELAGSGPIPKNQI